MADDGGTGTTDTRRQPHGYELTHRRPGAIRLRVLEGPGETDGVLRWRRRQVTGGRSETADLTLPDSSLSGLHFELSLRSEHVWLKDLGSTNGTWLGDHRVGEVGLPPGATFTVGQCRIQLVGTETVEVAMSDKDHLGELYGRSKVMREVFATLERMAWAGLDVLLQGETGTGKELAARALHRYSSRSSEPFVVLDCASMGPTLANAALFGHARGAFTDAREDRAGCFEEASGGTLFIDEVGDLPLELQPKLLRVLDRREVVRIGENHPRRIDVRVVAATHEDLRQMVARGEFRQDLYFRLSEVAVWLPPLRERDDDVVFLAERFAAEKAGPGVRLPEGFVEELRGRRWMGNVRELRAAVRAALSLATGNEPKLSQVASEESEEKLTLRELARRPWLQAKDGFERYFLESLMKECGGNLSEAERRSGTSRKSLRERMRRLGLR